MIGGGASRSTDPAAGSSSATDVSLREYVAQSLLLRDRQERERFGWIIVVGAVIWFFIERHLSDLNHENARVASITDTRLSADTYVANEQQRKSEQDRLDAWRKEVDKDRTQSISREEFQRDHRTDHRGSVGQWIAVASVIVAASGIFVAWIATH